MRKSPDNFKSKTTFIISNYCYLTQSALNYASLVCWGLGPYRTLRNFLTRSLKHHSIHSLLDRLTVWCCDFWVGILIWKQTYGWLYHLKIWIYWCKQPPSRINPIKYHIVNTFPSYLSQVASDPFTLTLSQG